VENAGIFDLRTVDSIAQNPTACRAIRVHAAPARLAFATRGDARNQHVIARLEGGNGGPGLLDDANTFVPEHATSLAARHIALENVQICAADRRSRDAHDRIGGRDERRQRAFVERFLARTVIHERFHHPAP
jgi:hypothetical protein